MTEVKPQQRNKHLNIKLSCIPTFKRTKNSLNPLSVKPTNTYIHSTKKKLGCRVKLIT